MLEGKSACVLDVLGACGDYSAVSEHKLQTADVITGNAVLYGSHAACVSGYVAADGSGLFARVGGIEQPPGFNHLLKILEHNARFHDCGEGVLVYFKDAVHQREIKDYALAMGNGRADKVGSRAAGSYGKPAVVRELHHRADLLGGLREHQRRGGPL